MNRAAIKEDAKSILNAHFSFFFLLFLPIFIIEVLIGWFGYGVFERPMVLTVWTNLNSLLSLLLLLLAAGIAFVCIDAMRQKLEYEQPLQKSFTIFINGDYFLGTLLIDILMWIFIFLWSLLLFIPGMIKSLAYSQAIYIYRDAIDRGERIGFLEAITQSRELMDGHKWELFVMQLSFLGWALLVVVTAGIAGIWVLPYSTLSFANYYNELVIQQNAEIAAKAKNITSNPSDSEKTD
ncbi:DUF975 family protein [Lentilactobacillus diolivorans]|nr:DUF975 family protein [Lentilactobacillus diolivorans]GEP24638.1 hypothetical protein LDI01_22310 [Lentilactobacillus diolivorans]